MTETIKKDNTSDGADEISTKLDELQKTIAKTSKARKITTFCSSIGIIIIIIILCVFIFSLYSFINNYNTNQLGLALQKSIPEIAETAETKKIVHQIQTSLLPNYQKALIAEIQNNSKKLHKQTLDTADEINSYMQNEMKETLLKSLTSAMIGSEKKILTKYNKLNLSEDRIRAILAESNILFTEQLTANLNSKLNIATQKLYNLNNSFEQLKNSISENKHSNIQNSEHQFIEALLELLVYQMNPAKGKLPALPAGGVK